jgi:MoxR-like ATPase
MSAFASVDDVTARLRDASYLADRRIATCVFLADRLGKPILAEGPAGVGKTELAKVLAIATSSELIRLQCYEGLDESKALYEWEYPKQLLYTQILRDKIGEVTAGAGTLAEAVDRLAAQEDAFFSERFLLARPLLQAIRAERRAVLLVDEVDRAEAEFEAFLLEVLSDFQVSVPELGTIKAKQPPLVVLTSNNAREMTDALRRRCLHLHIDFPDAAREREIVNLRLPGIAERLLAELVGFVQSVRALDLKKKPSVSETIDWARALLVLNASDLDEGLVRETLSVLLKYEGDVERAEEKLREILAGAKAGAAARA